ncbi:hypothetical protein [Planotetraspora sp. A-T 1434]|uniref:hypothetical protein n=1 Tax=Planotetraspora sp. A-T 1434 TaxID=2979219 RepID=UPI003965BB56
MIARVSTAVFGDTVVAPRIVPALCVGVVIPLVALVTRELGGSRTAQILAAAGTATATLPLLAGHTLLTLTPDLALWTAGGHAVRRPRAHAGRRALLDPDRPDRRRGVVQPRSSSAVTPAGRGRRCGRRRATTADAPRGRTPVR